jgi:hypothetical protein
MSGLVARLAVVLLGLAVASVTTAGQGTAPRPTAGGGGGPLRTSHHTLQTRLGRIAAGSALWRAAVDAVAQSGRRILLVTPDQVGVTRAPGGAIEAFDPTLLAEAVPVPHDGFRVNEVLVVVNLPLIAKVHARLGSLPGEHDADLDRILVHEVYGHALPYLLAGSLAGRCADPEPRERASQSCAIQRENAVRAELRLGRRVDAGLAGLFLARASVRW